MSGLGLTLWLSRNGSGGIIRRLISLRALEKGAPARRFLMVAIANVAAGERHLAKLRGPCDLAIRRRSGVVGVISPFFIAASGKPRRSLELP